jgi:cell division transport system permease protein
VFLIIGNTIRMGIASRREEIGIIKLIGGTDSFVRRPYLYTGMFLGLCGGLAALAIIEILFLIISAPATDLSLLYGTRFDLAGLGAVAALLLVSSGAVIGWLSARITVGVYLRHFEPGRERS